MEEENNTNNTENPKQDNNTTNTENPKQDNNTDNTENPKQDNNTLLYILGGGLVVALIAIAFLLFSGGNDGDSGEAGDGDATAMPPIVSTVPIPVEPTDAPEQPIPTPEPGDPTGVVIAPDGVNVRTGPGTAYQVIGIVSFGTSGEIIGKSADGAWWAALVPNAPNRTGWVSASFVEATDVDDVPVLPAPPLPTATAVPTPEPEIAFWADSTVIDQGQCTTLRWDVKNIQAIWVYSQGQPYQNFPVTGTGSRQECPATTTTYEMRVQRTDGLIELRQVTIQVNATNPLANTSWQLANMFGNPPVGGVNPMVFFYADGRISVNGGCNDFNSTYSTYGSQIYIGTLSGSQKLCGEPIDSQEVNFINVLQSATTFEINGGQLILKNSAGTEVLRFNRIG